MQDTLGQLAAATLELEALREERELDAAGFLNELDMEVYMDMLHVMVLSLSTLSYLVRYYYYYCYPQRARYGGIYGHVTCYGAKLVYP
jgi:hypothetical protein